MDFPHQPLRTPRLILRRWRPRDLEPFARLNADPRVMEFFPRPLEAAQSDSLAGCIQEHFSRHGFGLWAVEVPGQADFAGCLGLKIADFEAPFTPCVEVAWRLAAEHWGRGYATEGARAAVEFGFQTAGLAEIVSFTAAINHRSRRVMEKLDMTRLPEEDFEHPALPPGHRLRRHVLYRLRTPLR